MSKRGVLSGLTAALGAGVMVLAGMTGSAGAAEVGTMAVGTQIKNVATGRCLDSNYYGNVYTSPCAGDHNNPYQQWIGEWSGATYYLKNVQTGLYLGHYGSGNTGVRTVGSDSVYRGWHAIAVSEIQRYNFRPWGNSPLNLDSDAKGNVYLKEMNKPKNDNPYQMWWYW
ncbi:MULTISPECIES: RICIN domain-containing protein [unclassified Streptomyces]|uniref:RICIN domain-containing protein n=1 Tax=unclassified Streptomyces TaxID=2593676 RepID=UPI0037FA8E02